MEELYRACGTHKREEKLLWCFGVKFHLVVSVRVLTTKWNLEAKNETEFRPGQHFRSPRNSKPNASFRPSGTSGQEGYIEENRKFTVHVSSLCIQTSVQKVLSN